MGWCSGSDIFYRTVDEIMYRLKKGQIEMDAAKNITRILYNQMKDQDWDCDDAYGVDWVDGIMGYKLCEGDDCDLVCKDYQLNDEGLCWRCR